MVILIFIFLTPQRWFTGGERLVNTAHQRPDARTVLVSAQVVGNEPDKGQIEQQVKSLTGRSKVEVLAVRPVVDSEGRTRSFEGDIR